MNPAFLGSRLFTSEMPRFLHKIGQLIVGMDSQRHFYAFPAI